MLDCGVGGGRLNTAGRREAGWGVEGGGRRGER